MSDAPQLLSVVLVLPGSFDGVRKTIDHLRAQGARDRIELVLVAEHTAAASIDPAALAGFAASRIVPLERIVSRASANAAGAREARGAFVVFAEEHGFPDPGWAAALLRRHAERWSAVGPRIANANPDTLVSWCDLVVNYHAWLSPTAAGPVEQLPGHHTSYSREALAPYAGDLARWLDVEAELHRELVERGGTLFFEPEARVAHVNVSRWGAWLAASFDAGRVYAAARARGWSAARRYLYAAAWPLLPLVRLARLLAAWPRVEGMPRRTALVPPIAVALGADGAGQALGYLAGPGGSSGRLARFELERARQLCAADGAALAAAHS